MFLREIAERLILKYGTPEVWKLHIHASIRAYEEKRGVTIFCVSRLRRLLP